MKRLLFKSLIQLLKQEAIILAVYIVFVTTCLVFLSYGLFNLDEVESIYGNSYDTPEKVFNIVNNIHPWGGLYGLIFSLPCIPILIFFQYYFLVKFNHKQVTLLFIKGFPSVKAYNLMNDTINLITNFLIFPIYALVVFLINRAYDIGFQVIKVTPYALIFLFVFFIIGLIISHVLSKIYFKRNKLIATIRGND